MGGKIKTVLVLLFMAAIVWQLVFDQKCVNKYGVGSEFNIGSMQCEKDRNVEQLGPP